MKQSMAARIGELRQMTVAELVDQYREAYGKEPRVKHKQWLWKRIAWQWQTIEYGGLSTTAKNRLEELIAEIKIPPAPGDRTVSGKLKKAGPNDPTPGTTITREWKGREIVLHVRDDGFELDGVLHPSLTAAAFAATGSRWNGRLFFGLSKRKKR